ncbi:ABC transporter ATP-binding protein [Dickeya solani]|uniref:Sn-glycerol-3-phosphate ABC transporter ATP-binding protein UgpC n=2 Tax=Dickeya solani TaxID=1089444 RepID=A0AAP8Q5C6_9GAMM|nr:sn-glycerol-3-phosphate ABC transporter ATP-binding protein UgpC [Dickeya solani]ANE74303.1 sugar ABC transporter ATP-binding protein [Dickeya solani IPO 2222]AUC41519.1 Maltose/maltodextrin transport ATP-binding protein MalK [Dickeya solani RNS 08.23.3.1.A]AUH10283.1 sugar ABC transporter ATP-binding protein [Dickeya solani D s0432-1]AUH14227.1 sugar ABC transporter ATP-binding protein [Dickeya solani]AYQ48764.1 Maltose/maltodextrin import ATP-binding protein MalK [Dickeya solani]
MSSICLKNVTKRFGKTETLHNINLDIQAGEFAVFVGPSGCGKSTLLRMIAGLEEVSDGKILIDDEVMNDVAPAHRGVAMVFQSYALYPHMTVAENMGYGLKVNHVPKAEIRHQVEMVAKTLQLSHLLDRKPKQLSGGQRQRVAIGRAIVRNPKVFMFDEPLSNLDAELRVDMRLHIAKLHQELKTTMVYVTHDQVEAMTLADKIVVMNNGKVEQTGSPMALYYNPVNRFVAGFIGSPKMNFLPATVVAWQPHQLTVTLTADKTLTLDIDTTPLQPGDAITLGIRPEHLGIQPPHQATLAFQCEVVERLGNNTYLFGQSYGHDGVKILLPGDVQFRPWQAITVGFDAAHCLVFNTEGLRINADAPVPGMH